jgi:hypothetical protein
MPSGLQTDHGNLEELSPGEDGTIFGKMSDMLCLIEWRCRNAGDRKGILHRVIVSDTPRDYWMPVCSVMDLLRNQRRK